MNDEAKRWMRTKYELTIYQDEDAGNAAIPDQAEMMGLLDAASLGEEVKGFQSLHVEQSETTTQPTEEQEEMRRRIRSALNETGPNAPGPLLDEFAADVLTEVDALDDPDEDSAHEIADGAVPVYTYDRIQLFTESVDLATWEPELAEGENNSLADVAGRVLYDLARELADNAIRERTEREEELEERRDEARVELEEADLYEAQDEDDKEKMIEAAVELVGLPIIDSQGRKWTVESVGVKDGHPTISGSVYWDRAGDVKEDA